MSNIWLVYFFKERLWKFVKVFQKYIEWLESKAKDKTTGWHKFGMKVDFENGKSDPFFVGYLQTELFTMWVSQDITLADFWGIENVGSRLGYIFDKGKNL